MSFSQPKLTNPCSKFIEFKGDTGQFKYYDKELEKPVLVVQSRKDPVVNPKGTLRLFNKIGSETKEYYLFDYPRHGILLGEGRERVFKAIENFIRQWV